MLYTILSTLGFAFRPALAAIILISLLSGTSTSVSPKWLNPSRTRKIQERVERTLEWDIRQVAVIWYNSETDFARAHRLGPNSGSVLAVTRSRDQSIHLGPKVTTDNYDAVFAHELTHVILFQKYKTAIPPWLDEGLANWVSRAKPADRAFLRSQGYQSIRSLSHPFAGQASTDRVRYHYQLSQAAIEYINKRCDLSDLLQLAVGKKLETYLSTTCGIRDLDAELKAWIELPGSR